MSQLQSFFLSFSFENSVPQSPPTLQPSPSLCCIPLHNIFHSFWFQRSILSICKSHPPPTPPHTPNPFSSRYSSISRREYSIFLLRIASSTLLCLTDHTAAHLPSKSHRRGWCRSFYIRDPVPDLGDSFKGTMTSPAMPRKKQQLTYLDWVRKQLCCCRPPLTPSCHENVTHIKTRNLIKSITYTLQLYWWNKGFSANLINLKSSFHNLVLPVSSLKPIISQDHNVQSKTIIFEYSLILIKNFRLPFFTCLLCINISLEAIYYARLKM